MTTFIKSKAVKAVIGLVAAVAFGVFAHVAAASYTFTQYLTLGTTSAEVQQLQMALNTNGFTVSTTGAGSPGMESNYFGAKTKAAVTAFQVAKGISPLTGGVGPLTRAALNALSGSSTTLPPGCTSTSGFSPSTGAPCNGGTGVALPPGCTSTSGFSSTTGAPCNSNSGVTTGAVTVGLSSDNPASGYIVAGAATTDLLHLTFNGSGTVNSITLQRTGLSTNTALNNVYLYQGATRLTDAASVNAQGVIMFNGLNWAVNGPATLSVKADIASGANGQTVGATLTGYSVNGTAITANLAGNIFSISNGSGILGAVNVNQSNITPVSVAVNAGVTNYSLWSYSVNTSLHTMWLKSAAFHFVGSAPNNSLANIGLYVDGTKIASSTGINSLGYVVFDLTANPFSLTTGSHNLEVRADIVNGSYRSIQLTLQNAGDLMVTDSQVGVNVAAVSSGSTTTFSPVSGNAISVNQGSLSIQIDPTFNAMTNVTGGASNVAIGKYTVAAYGEDTKVQTVNITPTIGGSATVASGSNVTTLQNVELFFNGSQVGSAYAGTSGTQIVFSLGSSFVVPAGTTGTFEVRADTVNSDGIAYTGGTISITGNIPAGAAQGMNSLQTNASSITIPATSALQIQTGSLTVAKNPGYSSQSINPNTPNTKIGSFVLQNNNSQESVIVTNLNVGLNLTTAGSTNYANLKTSETSGSGSQPIQPTTAIAGAVSSNNFSVNFTIAPGATKTIDVYADIGSASSGAVVSQLNVTARGASSNVSICTSSNSLSGNGCTTGYQAGQTITVGSGTFGTPTVVTSNSTIGQYIAAGTTNGVTDASKAEFKFTAASGTATIIDLGFKDTSGTTLTAVRVGSTTATVAGGKAFLYGVNIPVPNGGAGAFVDAFASYAPVGATGVVTTTTGDLSSLLKLSYIKVQVGNTTTVYCANGDSPTAGNCTGGSFTGALPLSIGQTMTVVGSAPSVTVAQPSNVVLTTGNVEAIDVTVTANAAGPITLISFPITTNITSGAGTPAFTTGQNFVVKDMNNQTIGTATGSRSGATGSETDTVVLNSTTGYLLSAGQSQTFKVFVPVATLGTGQLPNTYLYTSLAATSGFVWQDTAGNAAFPTSTNITGSIYNYPSTVTSSIHN